MRKRIIFVRHGETQLTRANAYCGQLDVSLSDVGAEQARRLGGMLTTLLHGESAGAVELLSSDLARCRETATAALPGMWLQPVPELREISFGDWEGLTYNDIKDLPDYPAYAAGAAAPGGESTDEFTQRMTRAAEIIHSDAAAEADAACKIVVTHSGCIRMLLALLLELGAENSWRFKVDPASVSVVEISDGYAYLSLLNARGT